MPATSPVVRSGASRWRSRERANAARERLCGFDEGELSLNEVVAFHPLAIDGSPQAATVRAHIETAARKNAAIPSRQSPPTCAPFRCL